MAEDDLDDSEKELLQEAFDNLAFVEGARNLFPSDQGDPPDLRA